MSVQAYFHRMGHTVCEACCWLGNGNAALTLHLEAKHPEDYEQILYLREQLNQQWSQALIEGTQ